MGSGHHQRRRQGEPGQRHAAAGRIPGRPAKAGREDQAVPSPPHRAPRSQLAACPVPAPATGSRGDARAAPDASRAPAQAPRGSPGRPAPQSQRAQCPLLLRGDVAGVSRAATNCVHGPVSARRWSRPAGPGPVSDVLTHLARTRSLPPAPSMQEAHGGLGSAVRRAVKGGIETWKTGTRGGDP